MVWRVTVTAVSVCAIAILQFRNQLFRPIIDTVTMTTTLNSSRPVKRPLIPAEPGTIAIDADSVLMLDILRILHDTTSSAILVDLVENATCPDPLLRGRLSGPSLAMIEWAQPQRNSDNTTTIRGTYQVGIAGIHFLEILVLLCRNILPEGEMTNSPNFSANTLMETCLEDPHRNRITGIQASINVSVVSNSTEGYWVNNKYPSIPQPLPTRFQPQMCRDDNATLERCTKHTDLSRFNGYSFKWTNFDFSLERDRLKSRNITSQESVCTIGASHEYYLRTYFRVFIRSVSIQRWIGLHKHLTYHYPANLTDEYVNWDRVKQKCTAVVLGFGQWDMGSVVPVPTTPLEFEAKLKKLLLLLQSTLPDLYNNGRIFVRSTPYNPLGDWILTCPPKDWRSPFLVDAYNLILKRASQNLSFPYIDTSKVLIGPMWDSGPDFCHYNNKVGETEAIYILDRIFGLFGTQSQS